MRRREFLVSAGAGLAAGAFVSRAFANHHEKIALGIQLWTVKSEAEKDLEGTLRKLHALGFREIEFAGYYGRPAAEVGKLLRDIGLEPVSTHSGAGDIAVKGDQIIADAKALGLKYIIASSPAVSPAKEKLSWEERMKAVDLGDWKYNAELFNKFGRQVADAGMTFGYHNHSAEFKKIEGKTAFDHLFAMTDPALVKIQLDVGWSTVAQQDAVAILDQYKGRVVSLHVKDVAKRGADGKEPPSVAVGEGVVDWKKVLGKARANGVQHFFYEQEEPFTRPILESARMSAEYLSKLHV